MRRDQARKSLRETEGLGVTAQAVPAWMPAHEQSEPNETDSLDSP